VRVNDGVLLIEGVSNGGREREGVVLGLRERVGEGLRDGGLV